MEGSNSSKSKSGEENVISNTVSSIKWVFLLTFVQKILAIALSSTLVKIIRPELFGKANIQLELYLSTILFLSREGIRIALLRIKISSDDILKQYLINLSWLPVIVISILILMKLILLFYHGNNNGIFILYSLGALFEACGEPWVNMNLQHGQLQPKLSSEALAIIMKTLVTIVCIQYLHLEIYSFGIAQVCYGVTYFIMLRYLSHHKGSLLLKKVKTDSQSVIDMYVNRSSLEFACTTTFSSILKHILTESDKIALTFLSDEYNQGIFAVANNYGSLLARMLFLPLEDTSRVLFAKYSIAIEEGNKQSLLDMKSTLIKILKLIIFLGMICIVFGTGYCRLFVFNFLAKQWRNDELVQTLQFFCFHALILGVNGVTEAFTHVIASTYQYSRINFGYVLSTITFVISVVMLMKGFHLHTSGLVVANSLAFIVRIIFSLRFISNYFDDKEKIHFKDEVDVVKRETILAAICPSWFVLLVASICGYVVYNSSASYTLSLISASSDSFTCSRTNKLICLALKHESEIRHILIGGITGLVFLAFVFFSLTSHEKQDLFSFVGKFSKRSQQQVQDPKKNE